MDPRDKIPDFLAEKLADLDEPVLIAVAEYAESDGLPPDEVPEDVSTAFALQDDETMAAIAEFCRNLADGGDGDGEEADDASEGSDTAADDGDTADESDDKNPDQASGMFSHGW